MGLGCDYLNIRDKCYFMEFKEFVQQTLVCATVSVDNSNMNFRVEFGGNGILRQIADVKCANVLYTIH